MSRRRLRERVFELAHGMCEWPGCLEPAVELAHLHSTGMGGRRSADDPSNAMAACKVHARVTDGIGFIHADGRRVDANRETERMFEYIGYVPGWGSLAWLRADALTRWLERVRG